MGKVFYIGGYSDKKWVESLLAAADSLGKSLVLGDRQCPKNTFTGYEMIIIDAEIFKLDRLILLLKEIRAVARAKIVVVTSSPTWKEARKILLEGASDYTRKTDDREAIVNLLNGHAPTLIRGNIHGSFVSEGDDNEKNNLVG